MDAPPIFGIIPMPEDADQLPLPVNGPYYVITQTGFLLMDTNHFGRYLVPIKEIASLPEQKEVMWYNIPKMPDWIIGQAWSFFRAIYNEMKSEAMLDITWSDEKGYRLFVPPQRASGGGVQCTRNPEHYKGQMVGTLHSHCNFSAFHSGTDKHDASEHDGLHITIGNVLSPKPSIAIMIAKQGKQWDFKVEDVQEGTEIVMYDHPEWWNKYVSEPEKKGHVSKVNYGSATTPKGNGSIQHPPGSQRPAEIVVVGGKPNPKIVTPGKGTETSKQFALIEQLLKAHGTVDADTQNVLTEIENEMFVIEAVLNQHGIEIDYNYEVPVGGVRIKPKDDDDTIPAHWRYDF